MFSRRRQGSMLQYIMPCGTANLEMLDKCMNVFFSLDLLRDKIIANFLYAIDNVWQIDGILYLIHWLLYS